MFGEEGNSDIPHRIFSFTVLIYSWEVLLKTGWQSPTGIGILTPLNEVLWYARLNLGVPISLPKKSVKFK